MPVYRLIGLRKKLIMRIISTLGIQPDALWWKVTSQLISIAVMVLAAAFMYLIMHVAMAIKPVKLLVRFTSLTTLPFWRRYKYLR